MERPGVNPPWDGGAQGLGSPQEVPRRRRRHCLLLQMLRQRPCADLRGKQHGAQALHVLQRALGLLQLGQRPRARRLLRSAGELLVQLLGQRGQRRGRLVGLKSHGPLCASL